MADPVILQIKPRLAERIKATFLSSSRGWLNKLAISVFLVPGVLLTAVHLLPGMKTEISDVLTIALCLLFFPTVFCLNAFIAHRKYGHGIPSVTIDEQGVGSTLGSVSMRHGWDQVREVKSQMGLLLFFFDRSCAYFVPHRVTTTEIISQIAAFAVAGGVKKVAV